MKRVVAISGSLRKNSYNTLLLEELKNLLNEDINFEILDLKDIPLFNEDVEGIMVPEIVEHLKRKIESSDIVVISTPEYNYSISGVLKNALDWFSRGDNPPFNEKRTIILSASLSRFGGVRAQSHLRQILLCMNAKVLERPEVFISSVHESFDGTKLINEQTLRQLEKIKEVILK